MRLREIGTLIGTMQRELGPRRVTNVPEQSGPDFLGEVMLPVMRRLCLVKGNDAMEQQCSCDCQLK